MNSGVLQLKEDKDKIPPKTLKSLVCALLACFPSLTLIEDLADETAQGAGAIGFLEIAGVRGGQNSVIALRRIATCVQHRHGFKTFTELGSHSWSAKLWHDYI